MKAIDMIRWLLLRVVSCLASNDVIMLLQQQSFSGPTAAMLGHDADWSTHSAPGGGGWVENSPAASQPQPAYR